jgi:preprotein translocase subunit SecE
MTKLLDIFKNAKSEISKVIFPTRDQVRNAFISVFVVVTVVSLFLALIDLIMSFSLSSILEG